LFSDFTLLIPPIYICHCFLLVAALFFYMHLAHGLLMGYSWAAHGLMSSFLLTSSFTALSTTPSHHELSSSQIAHKPPTITLNPITRHKIKNQVSQRQGTSSPFSTSLTHFRLFGGCFFVIVIARNVVAKVDESSFCAWRSIGSRRKRVVIVISRFLFAAGGGRDFEFSNGRSGSDFKCGCWFGFECGFVLSGVVGQTEWRGCVFVFDDILTLGFGCGFLLAFPLHNFVLPRRRLRSVFIFVLLADNFLVLRRLRCAFVVDELLPLRRLGCGFFLVVLLCKRLALRMLECLDLCQSFCRKLCKDSCRSLSQYGQTGVIIQSVSE